MNRIKKRGLDQPGCSQSFSSIGGPGGSPPWRVQGRALVGCGAKPHKKAAKNLLAPRLTCFSLLMLASCSITPKPLTFDEHLEQESLDHQAIFAGQPPIEAPVTLYGAMARAIRFNLNHRLKLMETALAQNQKDVANFSLLPRLVAEAGYNSRSEESLSISRNVKDGSLSDASDASIFLEKSYETGSLGMTWNLLDFGVSYFQGKQEANRYLITKERRRKTIQNLVKDVRFAFWRAYGAQEMREEVDATIARAEAALLAVRAVEKERLRAPLESLKYRKDLLEILRQLEAVRADMAVAHVELAALMSVAPGTPFQLSASSEDISFTEMEMSLEKMEHLALFHRPELREEGYQARIDVDEIHKAIARLFPGLEFRASQQHDGNFFLVNHRWVEAGARVTWNLLNLLSGPSQVRLAKARQTVSNHRRLAMHMAVLSQVHVAYHQRQSTRNQLQRIDQLSETEDAIRQKTGNQRRGKTRSGVAYVRAATSAIMARMRRVQAFARFQEAAGQLYVTLGLDPQPEVIENHTLETLAKNIETTMRQWKYQTGWDPRPEEVPDKHVPPTTKERVLPQTKKKAKPASISQKAQPKNSQLNQIGIDSSYRRLPGLTGRPVSPITPQAKAWWKKIFAPMPPPLQ